MAANAGGLMHIRRLAASLVVAGLALGAAAGARQPQVIAIEHVSVIPMDRERVLTDQTVVVRDGRIADVVGAGEASVPSAATRIDGRGRFLIPALSEMHAHIPSRAADAERVLFMYAANGIGTIRSMLGDPSHFQLR